MVPEIYSKIIGKLVSKTKRGEVNWKKTSAGDKFLVSFKEFSLLIGTYFDEQKGTDYVNFQLIDVAGKSIDTFLVSESDEDWGDLVFELYNSARRKALRIDEAIEVIGKELGVDEDNDVPF